MSFSTKKPFSCGARKKAWQNLRGGPVARIGAAAELPPLAAAVSPPAPAPPPTIALSVPVTCTSTPPPELYCESTEAISARAPFRPQEATRSAIACAPLAVKVPPLPLLSFLPLPPLPPAALSLSPPASSSVCASVELSA